MSKASDPDDIQVVVLKNYESELSLILPELFKMCLKKLLFPDCWKVSLVVPIFKNVGERSSAYNYRRLSLLSVVIKAFEKLANKKYGPCSDFPYCFRSSQSTADLLIVESDRIARDFNRSGVLAVVLDVFKAFDKVWIAGLLHKLKFYGISGQVFDLVSSFLDNRWLQVVLDGKSSKDYRVKDKFAIEL